MAARYSCWQLADQATNFVLRRFEDIMQSEYKTSIQQLTEDVLLEILHSDNLEAGSETNVLLAILLWVDGDLKERAFRMGTLLSSVRLDKNEVEHQAEGAYKMCSAPARQALQAAAGHMQPDPAAATGPGSQRLPPRQSFHTSLLAAGGLGSDWCPFRTVEVYSPSRDRWEPGPLLPPQTSMSFASGATLGRYLYLLGEAAHVSQRVLALDRGSQCWQSRPCTLIPRAGMAVAAASDTLFVMGGRKGTSAVLGSVEAFSVEQQQWREIAELCTPRAALAGSACHGSLYALGGQAGKSVHQTVEVYNDSRDCWQLLSEQMQTERKYLAAACLEGRLMAVGGMTSSRRRLATIEALDPREGRWQQLPPMTRPRSSLAVASLHDRLYAVGGTTLSPSNCDILCEEMEAFDSHAGKWAVCQALPEARTGLAVALV